MQNVYETCVLMRTEATDASFQTLQATIQETITSGSGEVLIFEDWGQRKLAQATANGQDRGRYLYVMYQGDGLVNDELERRFRINEDTIKFIVNKLGDTRVKESAVKSHAQPFIDRTEGDRTKSDMDKERRMFTKRKSCWFTANKMCANWKDPSSYHWLVNEFGKISPARVTGVSRKHQRVATSAIKMARCIGLISHTSNRLAQ